MLQEYPIPPMKPLNSQFLRLVTLGATGAALVQSAQAATILTGFNSTAALSTTHGSNSAGTPNVALLWGASGGTAPTRWEGYTNAGWTNPSPVGGPDSGLYQLNNALAAGQSGATVAATYTIQFAPESGFDVSLISLDLNEYNGGGTITLDWNVSGTLSGSLGGGTFAAVNNANTTFNINKVGSGSETLTLSLTTVQSGSSTNGSYIAMDNLTFDQVPEPSSSLLGLVALGAIALRRNRR